MLQALNEGPKGGRWYSLMDKVSKMDNLRAAFAQVKRNQGAPGVDHVTCEMFEERLQENLTKIATELRSHSYRPSAIRRVEIPKPGRPGDVRALGIPTVRDRVVQTAMKHVLEPIFEVRFSEHSYGFRPGRGASDALRKVDALIASGYNYVLEIDIQSYFDSINHDKLLQLIREQVTDGAILEVLSGWLKQRIVGPLSSWIPEEGSPQGAVISPLLSNIYLSPLDALAQREGMAMVRYADDLVVMCRSAEEAAQALTVIDDWMEQAGLRLHPEKTRIVSLEAEERFTFLGYTYWNGGRGPSKQAGSRLCERLRPLLRRTNGRSMADIIKRVNAVLRGWWEYFQDTGIWSFSKYDKWVRMRLRAILWKRQKKRLGKRYRRQDANRRWPNAYLERCGFISLTQIHSAATAQLRLPLEPAKR